MFKRLSLAVLLTVLALPAGAVTVDLEGAIERAMEADPRISEREHLVDVARALLQEAVGSDDMFLDLNVFLAIAPEADGFYANGNNSCTGLPCTLANDGDEIRITQSALVLERVVGQFLFNKAAEGSSEQ